MVEKEFLDSLILRFEPKADCYLEWTDGYTEISLALFQDSFISNVYDYREGYLMSECIGALTPTDIERLNKFLETWSNHGDKG